ncbi:hypothetical protein AB6A40_003630 [Gnathostoma spinigerum]|uniref:C2H2-type domain-containing protein n=1 Tax=Gnathostoma spinigerum TaxID=75299 RepID=A0ABD6ECK1_9BILA
MHAFDTNHAVQRKDDNYCEELAKNIFRDCLESATKDPVVSSSAETETGVTSCLERKNKDFLPSSSGCEKISSEVVNSCDSSVSTCINTATTVKSNEEKLKCPDTSITPIFPSSFHRQLIPHKRTKVKRTVRTAINDTSRPKKVVRHSKSKRSPNDEKCLFPGDADSPSPESSYCSAEPSLLAACQKKDSLESAGSVLKDTKLTNSGPVSYSVSDSCGLQLLMISSICKTPASRILSSPDLIEKRSREEFDLCGGGNKDVCNHSQPTAAVRAPESPTSHPSVDNDDRRRNESNCGQSMPKDLSEVVESLLQNSTRTMTSCHKCGMSVDSSYLVRKFHAMQYHFNAVDSDPEAFLLLPAAVKECFPSFLASSDLECNECGKKYATERGRRAHVLSEHFHEMFVCVAMDCSFIVSTPMQLKKHLKVC